VTAGVFVASGAKVPNPDQASPGPLVGINSSIMGDMMDLVMAAFNGDHKRVVADVHDMARNQSIRKWAPGMLLACKACTVICAWQLHVMVCLDGWAPQVEHKADRLRILSAQCCSHCHGLGESVRKC
jgi:hypothetical protein